jgi:hypothetical protein
MSDLDQLAQQVQIVLFSQSVSPFRPHSSWEDFGMMLVALESRGLYLMTNSVADPKVRRMAAFHKATEKGYPCVGMSGWGSFASVGEAVLRAAHAALTKPMA